MANELEYVQLGPVDDLGPHVDRVDRVHEHLAEERGRSARTGVAQDLVLQAWGSVEGEAHGPCEESQ